MEIRIEPGTDISSGGGSGIREAANAGQGQCGFIVCHLKHFHSSILMTKYRQDAV